MIALLVRAIALAVPAALRPRWREEWSAEIAHVTSRRDRLRLLAGAIPDMFAARRLNREERLKTARGGVLTGFDQDLRFALRGLVKSRAFAAGAICSLAIGIAATSTAFSFMNAAVFRPFPAVTAQHELVRLTVGRERYQKFSTRSLNYGDYLTARDTLTTMAEDTGGRAFFDSNSFGAVFDRVVSRMITVRPFVPRSRSARMRVSGIPHNPNPPTMTLAPSGISATAASALGSTLFIARIISLSDRRRSLLDGLRREELPGHPPRTVSNSARGARHCHRGA